MPFLFLAGSRQVTDDVLHICKPALNARLLHYQSFENVHSIKGLMSIILSDQSDVVNRGAVQNFGKGLCRWEHLEATPDTTLMTPSCILALVLMVLCFVYDYLQTSQTSQ